MKKVLFTMALAIFIALPNVEAQEKKKTKEEKDIDVKIEKIVKSEDGEDHMKTKIIILKDGKVIAEEEGENIDLADVLKDSGLSAEEINKIEVKVDSKGGNKMMWVSKDGENAHFNVGSENVFVVKDRKGNIQMEEFHGPHKEMAFFTKGSLGVYDYSKSDKETKEFNVKQKKEIEFSDISISAMGGGIKLSFECPKNNLEVSVKDVKGKKVFFEKKSAFEGKYVSFIHVDGEKDTVYILEVKSGDKNWLQKIKVE